MSNTWKPLPTARRGWTSTSRGINDWNHDIELLKQHDNAKGHKESSVTTRMAEQSASVGNWLIFAWQPQRPSIRVSHLPGIENVAADAISSNFMQVLFQAAPETQHQPYTIP